ncbi:MAG: hypothetical protein FVQ77_07480 [Cytophagales bacterium]|nr:hypothetical protein [Cytophagales bacterium]
MYFQSEQLYHIYNIGNNKQKIFFGRENYLFFLRKIKEYLLDYCEILAYCLMPNHFHFLIYTKSWQSSDDWMIRGDGSSDECVKGKATYSSDDANPLPNQSSDDGLSVKGKLSSDDWMIRGEGSSDECGRVKSTYSSDDANPDSNQSSDDNQLYKLNNAIGVLLRSYTRAINIQERRTGSLFQQKTKEKCLDASSDEYYPLICFNYIHKNPMEAGLVKRMEDWEFSSFKEYIGKRNETLCNQKLARELVDLPSNKKEFYEMSYKIIDDDDVNKIF